MTSLHASLYAVALISCILWLHVSRARESSGHRYLKIYLLLQTAGFACEWLMLNPSTPAKALWLSGLMSVSLLVAPCLWLYAREITTGRAPRLRELSVAERLYVTIGVALTLPLLMTTHPGRDYIDPNDVAGPMQSLVIHGTMLAVALMFLAQVPFYLKACVQSLRQHANESQALFSTINQPTLNTLRLLILVVFAKWLVDLFRVLHCVYLGQDRGFGVVFAMVEVGATVGAVLTVAGRSSMVAREDQVTASEAHVAGSGEPASSNAHDVSGKSKYVRSALNAAARARILRKLEQSVATQGLHRDPGLTLRGLCEHLRENPHYVSQVLNQDLGTSFYDFINRLRVEDARMALATTDRTVLEIATEVGFNSKSTFNAVFRKHTGMTPSQHRAAAERADLHSVT